MKQHITPDQAKEITEEQFNKLFNNQHWGIVRRDDWANFHHKKVTIGKMLELLEPYTPKIEKGRDWTVELVIGELPNYDFPRYQNKVLCDALWKAIKLTF